MTPMQLDLIPDHVLAQQGTWRLRRYLHDRGLTMTLLELDDERRRRGVTA